MLKDSSVQKIGTNYTTNKGRGCNELYVTTAKWAISDAR